MVEEKRGLVQKILELEGRGNWRSLIFSLVSGDVPYYSSIPVSNLWVSYWKENCRTLTEYFLLLLTPSALLLFIFLHFFYMTTEMNSVHLYCLADTDWLRAISLYKILFELFSYEQFAEINKLVSTFGLN